MADYSSKKRKNAISKKRAGNYKTVDVKSSDFLPRVFQTNLNKKWLDSTLDRMVSKGALEDIDAFIGDRHSKYNKIGDTYLSSYNDVPQLQPGIITKDESGDYVNTLQYDDISNAINNYFDDYNYHNAYNSQSYVYNPPVDKDKFFNYNSYFWAPKLPVIESDNTNGTGVYTTDVITDINHKVTHTFTDDNNTFELQNGMRINLEAGYGALTGNSYLVTGVGKDIELRLYSTLNPVTNQEEPVWTDHSVYKDTVSGFWDRIEIIDWTNQINGNTDVRPTNWNILDQPYAIKDEYNKRYTAISWVANTTYNIGDYVKYNDEVYSCTIANSDSTFTTSKWNNLGNTAPLMYFYDSQLSKKRYLADGMLIRFSNTWTALNTLDSYKLFEVSFTSNGYVFTKLIDAAYDSNGNVVQTTASGLSATQLKTVEKLGRYNWDLYAWDTLYEPNAEKDYLVIDRSDSVATAWSRGNFWIHRDTLLTVDSLVNNMVVADYLVPEKQARRPIIEFNSGLSLYDHRNKSGSEVWKGPVDFILQFDSDNSNLVIGNSYIILGNNEIREKTQTGHNVLHTLNDGDTLLVMNALSNGYRQTYRFQDVYWNSFTNDWNVGQTKTKPNQAPLFKLYDNNEVYLGDSTYSDSEFTGNKIFGYKVGTGTADTELDFPLVYKDVGSKADYVFQTFIETDRVEYSVRTSTQGYVKEAFIPGTYHYTSKGKLRSIYNNTIYNLGAKVKKQCIPESAYTNYTIDDIGYNNWRTTKDFICYSQGTPSTFTVQEVTDNGLKNERQQDAPTIILSAGETYKFYDLKGVDASTQLDFYAEDKTTVLTNGITRADDNNDSYNEVITFAAPLTEQVLYYGYPTGQKGKIIITDGEDQYLHKLYIDGKYIDPTTYTINATSIEVSNSLFTRNSIIDIEYYPNNETASLTTVTPEIHEHNPTNKTLTEFTISETFDHWNSFIRCVNDFSGESFGINNYHKRVQHENVGGTIFKHHNISIMHDLNYADPRIDIRESLFRQAKEYWAFKRRFVAQVKRLYTSNSYLNVRELVSDALKSFTTIRRTNDLHANSNMVYYNTNKEQVINLIPGSLSYELIHSYCSDDIITDHLYVYLSDNYHGLGYHTERLLQQDIDYTVNNGIITLIITPQPAAGIDATLTIHTNDMEDTSNVPASLVKLGLGLPHNITVESTSFIGHDGSEYTFSATADLYNMRERDFDVVNACMLELETRIWNGLIRGDYYKSAEKYLPAQHRLTWYDVAKMDNYTEQLFADYKGIMNIEETGYDTTNGNIVYDGADPTTWNYSSMNYGHYSPTKLPGYWKGAYVHLFGTCRPDLYPWHMLGVAQKPSWWDTHYSWTDATKRANLIKALKKGHCNDPTEAVQKLDPTFARNSWDWRNIGANGRCPVNTSGTLVAVDKVLAPTGINAVDAAQPFVYGDWGPKELTWRQSILGKSAMLDAVIKLSPAQTFKDFFQPGYVTTTDSEEVNRPVTTKTGQLINPKDFYYPSGSQYEKFIKEVRVRESTSGWGSTSTLNIFSRDSSGVDGTATITVIGGKITKVNLTKRGINYIDTPVLDVQNTGTGVDLDANVEFDVIFEYYQSEPLPINGITAIQYNNLNRNYYSDNYYQQYNSLDTQLLQKVGGFTNERLLHVYTESGPTGSFKINENDFDITMYSGVATDVANVTKIEIEKLQSGYKVRGIGYGKQKFYFVEPEKNSQSTELTLETGAILKKYKLFAKTASSIEYDAVISKVQDLYDFARGYITNLTNIGIQIPEDADATARDIAVWAVTTDVGDVYEFYPGSSIKYTAKHGRIVEFNSLPGQTNTLLDNKGAQINKDEIIIDRVGNEITVELLDESPKEFGSIGFAEVDFEHVIVFKNTTQFNDIIFNSITNQRHHRLLLDGQRTRDWDGNTRAPGYLVFEDKIVENFDTNAQSLDDFYKFTIENISPSVTKLENTTIGNYKKDWINATGLNENTWSRYYQGLIRDKGTLNVLAPFERSNVVNQGKSKLDLYEEWMFLHSNFGDTKNVKATEFFLPINEVGNPAEYVAIPEMPAHMIVNQETSATFNTETIDDFNQRDRLRTAGGVIDLLEQDVKIIRRDEDIESAFDSTAEYANIETWNNQKAYKLGDRVRKEGVLYKCKVPSTGFTTVASGLTFTGTVNNPTFNFNDQAVNPNTPSATISDGTTNFDIWFDEKDRVFNPIVVTSNAFTTVASPTDITIDGRSFNITSTTLVTIIDTTQPNNGNPYFNITGTTQGNTATYTGRTATGGTGSAVIFDVTRTGLTYATTIDQAGSGYTAGDVLTIDGLGIGGASTTNDASVTVDTVGSNGEVTSVTITGTPVDPDAIIIDNTAKTLEFNGAIIALFNTTFPAGSNLTRQNVATIIANQTNFSNTNATANAVEVVFDVLGNVNGSLVVGTGGTANTELGITAPATYNPATIQVSGPANMNASDIATILNNNTNLQSYIVASATSNGELVITKNVTSNTNTTTVLTLGGTLFNLIYNSSQNSTTVVYNDVQKVQTLTDAIKSINDRGISGVTATDVNGRLTLTSSNPVIYLGTNSQEMNTNAGIDGGTYYETSTTIVNTFDPLDWDNDSINDPARIRIQTVNDASVLNYDNLTGNIRSIFNDWNVYKVQDEGLYSKTTDTNGNPTQVCSVCAGTATIDGNDAEISLNVNHSLEPGDMVMLLNTTTVPNIDGIHTVTKIGDLNNPNKFYIDRYIEECGSAEHILVLRNTRFANKADLDATLTMDQYNWTDGDYAYTDYPSTTNSPNTDIGTYVWIYNSSTNAWVSEQSRTVNSRPKNDGIANVLLYNAVDRETIVELEVFDPVRKIIPGAAGRQIDIIDSSDYATYTNSTAEVEFEGANISSAWAHEEVGKVWWDTTNAVYFDYNQGTRDYKKDYWGRLYSGGSIEVYEWTKSTVAPDEWEDTVNAKTKVFGVDATGEAYKLFDKTINDFVYYYTKTEEYNNAIKDYETVYYFWVKNKTTIPATAKHRFYNVKNIAEAITNPTTFGISWCAAIDEDTILLANVGQYTDRHTVVQINKKLDKGSHSSWTVIQEGTGLIPTYWYKGVLDNLCHINLTYDKQLPNKDIHSANRVGDDRRKKQTWWQQLYIARRTAAKSANIFLKNMNLVQELDGKWDRIIGPANLVTDIEIEQNTKQKWASNLAYNVGDEVVRYRKVYECQLVHTSTNSFHTDRNTTGAWKEKYSIFDLTDMWIWTSYVNPNLPELALRPSKVINQYNELANIDGNIHSLVKLRLIEDGMDRTEEHYWNGTEWVLYKKKNATIKFLPMLWEKNTWDSKPWDTVAWDEDKSVFWYYLVKALRNDLFIDKFTDNFNKWWFTMIRYALVENKQVDWAYKTTYVQLDVTTDVDTEARRYYKNGINEFIGYFNDVKPYHTKIRNLFAKTIINEEPVIAIEEDRKMEITVKMEQDNAPTYYVGSDNTWAGGTTYAAGARVYYKQNIYSCITANSDTVFNLNNWIKIDSTVSSGFSDTTFDLDYQADTFTGTATNVVDLTGGDFVQPERWNYIDDTTQRRHEFKVETTEHLNFVIQTNPIDNTDAAGTRTFVVVTNNNQKAKVYALEVANETTLSADANEFATTINVTDGSKFQADGGYAWSNGEIIKYGQTIGNQLLHVERTPENAKSHTSGDTIVDVTSSELYSTETDNVYLNDYYDSGGGNWLYRGLTHSGNTGYFPTAMQNGTKGIVL